MPRCHIIHVDKLLHSLWHLGVKWSSERWRPTGERNYLWFFTTMKVYKKKISIWCIFKTTFGLNFSNHCAFFMIFDHILKINVYGDTCEWIIFFTIIFNLIIVLYTVSVHYIKLFWMKCDPKRHVFILIFTFYIFIIMSNFTCFK